MFQIVDLESYVSCVLEQNSDRILDKIVIVSISKYQVELFRFFGSVELFRFFVEVLLLEMVMLLVPWVKLFA